MKKYRGTANVQCAWLASSKKALPTIMKHGPVDCRLSSIPDLYAAGVHLAVAEFANGRAKYCDIDENIVQYMILCCIIIGKMELLFPESGQCFPSSEDVDSGVDDLHHPKPSTDSNSVDLVNPSFSSSRLVQSFPRHDKGTLAALPRFVTSLKGTFLPNPDASLFNQQDKRTANRLFAASSGAKISHVKHNLYSIKKGELTVREYVVKIENVCALLAASGSAMSEAEKVEVVLAGLSSDFDAVLILTSFSTETLLFQRLVDIFLEFESRQLQVAREVLIQAHLVEPHLVVTVVDSGLSRDVHGGRLHRRGFQLRIYDSLNTSNTVRVSSFACGQKLQGGVYGDSRSGENLLGRFQNQSWCPSQARTASFYRHPNMAEYRIGFGSDNGPFDLYGMSTRRHMQGCNADTSALIELPDVCHPSESVSVGSQAECGNNIKELCLSSSRNNLRISPGSASLSSPLLRYNITSLLLMFRYSLPLYNLIWEAKAKFPLLLILFAKMGLLAFSNQNQALSFALEIDFFCVSNGELDFFNTFRDGLDIKVDWKRRPSPALRSLIDFWATVLIT
ncbi:hypothetical protein Goshw_009442 [Gossypium schwendimanii]|uniref:PARP catalytic domain-containing protein n=1 Tax=Gossypium schwendimanii TaxID=34291 RepID=A0A7J9LV02_GOSSC|nr:hypothetical protein [Gossypium schwendimanii]